MESYGTILRRIRGDRTKEAFSKQIGITVQALSAYESGGRQPRDEVKQRISRIFRSDYFFEKGEHK